MKIHFDEADPLGIAFAGNIFRKTHHCYEDFIENLGGDHKEFFMGDTFIYPIRHVEVEYFKPLRPLNHYKVGIHVLHLSEFRFQLQFDIGEPEQLHCQVRSTHVCCKKQKMEKSPIPMDLKHQLEKYLPC